MKPLIATNKGWVDSNTGELVVAMGDWLNPEARKQLEDEMKEVEKLIKKKLEQNEDQEFGAILKDFFQRNQMIEAVRWIQYKNLEGRTIAYDILYLINGKYYPCSETAFVVHQEEDFRLKHILNSFSDVLARKFGDQIQVTVNRLGQATLKASAILEGNLYYNSIKK